MLGIPPNGGKRQMGTAETARIASRWSRLSVAATGLFLFLLKASPSREEALSESRANPAVIRSAHLPFPPIRDSQRPTRDRLALRRSQMHIRPRPDLPPRTP